MDIRDKLYPHPVLVSGTDDFIESSFEFQVDASQGIREVKLSFHMELHNAGMTDMIQDDKAEYLIHIECPLTCYRNVVKSGDEAFSVSIQERYLNGKVTLCAFVVAKKDIPSYVNPSFNSDYEGIRFAIDKGTILAIGGQYNLNITKDVEELAKVPSIFTICKHAADSEESMSIDMDGDKIAIALSAHSFQDYKLLINMPSLLPAFHAMVIIPALIYVFETLRREGIEEYEDRRWFAALKKTLSKREIKLDEKMLSDIPSYELAQKLLELPLDRALDAITMFDDGEEED